MTARWLKPAAAAVLGLVVGAGTALALQRLPEPTPPRATATGSATGLAPPGTPGPRPPAPGPPVGERSRAGNEVPGLVHSPPAPADRVLLVWTPGRLPGGLAGRAGRIRGVRAVTVVKGGLVGLTGSVDSDGRPLDRPRPGTTVPLEAIGFDPATYPALLPAAARAAFARLRPGEALLPALAGAMGELRQRDLARLVDPEAYRGCWNPRLTRSGSGVSRHAWGAAVDLNVAGNPTGLASAQDPRLVEVMERWGFTWGGRWLVPDPAHFEWLRSPRPPGPGS